LVLKNYSQKKKYKQIDFNTSFQKNNRNQQKSSIDIGLAYRFDKNASFYLLVKKNINKNNYIF
jgi:predicted porin